MRTREVWGISLREPPTAQHRLSRDQEPVLRPMEDGYYQRGLEKFGLRVETPYEEDRVRIQQIQSQLARGIMAKEFRSFLAALIEKHAGLVDAVVLACTELPLAV